MNKKIVSVLLSMTMLLTAVCPVSAKAVEKNDSQAAEEQEISEWEEVYISSIEDLQTFSKNCWLDSWSRNKNVHLTTDLDLSNTDFVSIPTFGGYFDGAGHVIEGLQIRDSLSYVGLFCYLQESGTVMNLSVKGEIHPSGRQSVVGGIVGDNWGVIQNCSFDGIVNGNDYTGGIVGFNESTGYIAGSSSKGKITGLHFTGGIAGENMGSIMQCSNEAEINTSNIDRNMSLDDINAMEYSTSMLDFNSDDEKKDTTDAIDSTVDTGGIVGFSSGVIQGCTNKGNIGYEHVGYNIGGIAGRQSGYLYTSTNKGIVLGRKDVGGIVGQAEPYISVDLSKDIVYQMSESIQKLHDLIDKTLRDAGTESDAISSRLSMIQSFTDKALKDTGYLADQTVAFADGLSAAANEVSNRADYAMDEAGKDGGVIDQASQATGNITDAVSGLDATVNDLDIYQYMTEDEKNRYDADKTAIEEATKEYNGYYQTEYDSAIANGKTEEEAGQAAKASADTQFEIAHSETYSDYIQDEVADMTSIIENHSAEMTDAAIDDAKIAIDAANRAAQNLESATSQTKDIINNLNSREDITLPKLGDAYRQHTNSLVTNLQGMSDNMGFLNSEMNSSSDVLLSDMEQVNDQFNVIMLLFMDAIDGALDMDYTTMYEDNSRDVAADSVDGTVADCINQGSVKGDLDIGGITGTMAIEYDFDLESDVTGIKDSKANSTYETKCVMRGNVNHGTITAQKSYVGGIAGLQEMGMALGCENYGKVISDTGNYVGGIMGQSLSAIESCYAKCRLSGKSYVAGITGSGSDIENCYSMVRILEADSFFGAIAGETEQDGVVADNYFVSDDIAGIDRISYSKKAEPISYEQLLSVEEVPQAFHNLTVNFLIDGESVKKLTCQYGDQVTKEEYPDIPKQDGFYAAWDQEEIANVYFDEEISADYVRYLTSLAGNQKRDNNQSIFLVDGMFQVDDKLGVLKEKQEDISLKNVIESYSLVVPEDGQTAHMVRYQAPEEIKSFDIYILNGEQWDKVQTQQMGMYHTFNVSGKHAQITIVDTGKEWYDYWWAILCAVILLTGSIILVKKKRRPKQQQKK